jgi:quinolinate synthase
MKHLNLVDDKYIDPSLDLEVEILKLKKERNAVILAHYYQDSEIQDIADFIGDSLQLSQEAAKTKADVICFAGVHFMAETAKILSPEKIVVLPDLSAGCSLSDGCKAPDLLKFQNKLKEEVDPDLITISYINCSAEVKAISDYICTSSNAVKITKHVASLTGSPTILFAPDKNLGRWVHEALLKDKINHQMIMWQGSCIVHETFSERKLIGLRERHPGAKVLAHPECEEQILRLADFIGSTAAILKYASESSEKEFIIATEAGILHQMQKAAPDKIFIPAPPEANCACNECPFMKKNTLEKVYLALRDLDPQINLSDDLIQKARVSIDRMMALS